MFLNILKQLKTQPDVLVKEYQTYFIIRAKHKNKDGTQTDVFYALQPKDVLGSGTWGIVYKGQKINPKTGELEPNKFYAIKILDNTKTDKSKMEKEIAAQSAYYPTAQPIIVDDLTYIITEYLPGKNMSDLSIINDLRSLSFSEKTAAITQLLLQIELLRKKIKFIEICMLEM